jgi:hypothetical protein
MLIALQDESLVIPVILSEAKDLVSTDQILRFAQDDMV